MAHGVEIESQRGPKRVELAGPGSGSNRKTCALLDRVARGALLSTIVGVSENLHKLLLTLLGQLERPNIMNFRVTAGILFDGLVVDCRSTLGEKSC